MNTAPIELRSRAGLLPGQTLVQTYEHDTIHPTHGPCTMRIYRAIGNDSGTKVTMTVELLKKTEPNVGMWTGDVIQFVDAWGNALEEVFGKDK